MASGITRRGILLAVLLLLSLGFSFILCVYLALPMLAESRVRSLLAGMEDLEGLHIGIRQIGAVGTDIGPIRLGQEDTTAVEVDAVRLGYSPQSLLNRKVDTIQINGLVIHCELQDGQLRFPGIDLEKRLNSSDKPPAATDSTVSDLPFKRAEIRNGTILLNWEKKPYRLPFEVDVTPNPAKKGSIRSLIRIYPRSQKISAALTVDLSESELRLELKSDDIDLDRFGDLTRFLPDTVLGGSIVTNVEAAVGLTPFAIKSVDLSIDWKNPAASTKALGRIVGGDASAPSPVFHINAHGRDNAANWKVDTSPLYLNIPPTQTVLAGLRMDIRKTKSAWSVLGSLPVTVQSHPGGSDTDRLSFASFSLPLEISADIENSGNWKAVIHNSPDQKQPTDGQLTQKWISRLYGAEATVHPPRIEAFAAGSPDGGTLNGELTIPGITIIKPPTRIQIAKLVLTAAADWSAQSGQVNTDLVARAVNTSMRSGAATITAPLTSISGNLKTADSGVAPRLTGSLKTKKVSLKQTDPPLQLTGGVLNLPFAWPGGKPAPTGSFRISSIRFDQTELGSISAKLRQKNAGIGFSGSYDSSFVKGLSAVFEGRLGHSPETGPHANLSLKVPSFRPAAPIQMEDYAAAAKGITATGRIEATAEATYGPSGFSGTARLDLQDGEARMDEKKISITGIATTVNCDELPRIRTRPGQQIRFAKAEAGGISIDGGSVDFQVESPRSLLIEKSSFSWCDGTIDTQSLRIIPGTDHYPLVLYCDRLDLAMLLKQLAGVKAGGKGSVNGRIPVDIAGKKITFKNGFLYSTPGYNGKIQLVDTDILTTGMPVNTPQFAYLELAREALKDFEYSWVKLGMESEGEELLLQLKFNGKPTNPLPFEYKEEIGGFVRVGASSPGSEFSGIRLDVNMRGPLNKMLQYSDKTNMLQ